MFLRISVKSKSRVVVPFHGFEVKARMSGISDPKPQNCWSNTHLMSENSFKNLMYLLVYLELEPNFETHILETKFIANKP